MSRSPLEQIRELSDVEPAEDETIREYVIRVAEEHDIEPATLEAGLSYVTEYHFSDDAPEDDRGFETFLGQLREPTGSPGSPTEHTETSDAPGTPRSDGTSPSVGVSDSDTGDTQPETDQPTTTEASSTEQSGSAAELTASEPSHSPGERGPSVVGLPGGSDTGTTTGFKTGIQGKEPRKLLVRFLIVVATAPVIGWMLSRAWVPGNTIYQEGRNLLAQVTGVPGQEAAQLFALGMFGLYLGMLVLFTLDVKKRVQAMLLWLGTGLGVAAVAVSGWVIPNLELTQLNVLGFVLGVVAGVIVELDQLRAIDRSRSSFRRPTLSNGELPEFRYAAWLLFAVLVAVVMATLGQVILAGSVTVVDPIASLIFLGMLFGFVRYESETNYITLGPERSGKSMLMLGLCLELLRDGDTHPKPNDYLQNGLERTSNLQSGQAKWPIPSTSHDELRAASFEVISGYYFPRRLGLTALDYAGQHLSRIADLISRGETDSEGNSVPEQVVDWVVDADTLLFILDVERLVYPEEFHEGEHDEGAVSWGLEHYTTITEGIEPDETILVASKCDILIDQGYVDAPRAYDSYAEFREAVTDHLTARPDVQELLATTGESTIRPVYYVTEQRDGQYRPYLDEDGNLVPVGYDQLVGEMRGRQ
ncbi:hypothetical protein ACFQJ7_09910 [Halovenus rubra]|uniref:Uncharacterized protein n=2 Tax=Halovenus rubra TaxID=869890 RepID=A0ABD5X5D5_9EURY|nr:hypothetical protein [Halovenus rubra]